MGNSTSPGHGDELSIGGRGLERRGGTTPAARPGDSSGEHARPGDSSGAHPDLFGWWVRLFRGREPAEVNPVDPDTRTLIVATTNAGKLREVSEFLADIPGVTLGSLRDVSSVPHVDED